MTDQATQESYTERVVQVKIKMRRGGTAARYAIYDAHLGYWRGTSALTDYDAWTRDTTRRALFSSRAEAERELTAILRWRCQRETDATDGIGGEPLAA